MLKTITIVLALLLSLFGYSQQLPHKNYTVEDGLASSTVYMTLQDSKGFIWCATETGLSRFDGQKFYTYSYNEALTDNTVLKIYEDSKGTLWLTTLSGKVFCLNNQKIIPFELKGDYKNAIIKDVIEGNNGSIWLASNTHGLLQYKNGKIIQHDLFSLQVSRPSVVAFSKSVDNTIWAITARSLLKIQNEKVSAYNYLEDVDKTINGSISAIDKEKILYAKNKQLLLFASENKQQFIIKDKEINNKSIHTVYTDREHHIWLATNAGLVHLGNDLSNPTFANTFFKDKSIASVMQDNEGSLWVSTMGDGIFFIPSKHIFTYTTNDGLADNKINFITGDNNASIWIGTENGKLNYLKNNKWQTVELPASNSARNRTSNMMSCKNTVWIALDDILAVVSVNNKKPVVTKTYSFKSSIKCLTAHPNEGVWVGTHSELFHIQNDSTKSTGIRGRITATCVDFNGKIWLCKDGEIIQYDGKNIVSWANKSKLLQARSYFMQQVADSTLWIATHGVGMVRIKNGKINNISKQDGLADNTCNNFFIENDKKTLWAATNKGLSKIVFSSNGNFKIYNYTTKHGLPSDEINAVFKHNDTLWLATNRGVCFFDEKNIQPNTTAPPVYFSGIKIMGKDTAILPRYELPYYQSHITISYTGLAFRNLKSMQYRYKMQGIDTAWNYTSYNHMQYPKLPHGKYTFSIEALNEDGFASKQADSIHFVISPPYWQTWWFRISAVLSFILITMSIAHWRVNTIRKQEKEKTTFNKKIAELEMAALRSQMNPHFIFNCLNSIQNFINKGDEDQANLYLIKFAGLLRMILENSREEKISLEHELSAMQLYVDLEMLRFENTFDYSISIDEDIYLKNIKIPPLLLQPFIENAIRHGLLHKKEKGNILLTLKKENHYLLCTIEDNGIGRKKAEELKQQHIHKKQSLGIQITEERIQALLKNKQENLYLTVIDLQDENGKAKGTRVEIRIPIQ